MHEETMLRPGLRYFETKILGPGLGQFHVINQTKCIGIGAMSGHPYLPGPNNVHLCISYAGPGVESESERREGGGAVCLSRLSLARRLS